MKGRTSTTLIRISRTDVVLVVGANGVTNSDARRPGDAVSGTPILNVDQTNSVIVDTRSLGHRYAGVHNELRLARRRLSI